MTSKWTGILVRCVKKLRNKNSIESHMEIIFTSHAKFKLDLLKEHGFTFTEEEVNEVIERPDFVKKAKYNRLAAHKSLDNRLALRVIYEKNDMITVVTIMVVKRNRYDI